MCSHNLRLRAAWDAGLAHVSEFHSHFLGYVWKLRFNEAHDDVCNTDVVPVQLRSALNRVFCRRQNDDGTFVIVVRPLPLYRSVRGRHENCVRARVVVQSCRRYFVVGRIVGFATHICCCCYRAKVFDSTPVQTVAE